MFTLDYWIKLTNVRYLKWLSFVKKKKNYNEALYACKARAFPYKNAPIQHVAQLALLQR